MNQQQQALIFFRDGLNDVKDVIDIFIVFPVDIFIVLPVDIYPGIVIVILFMRLGSHEKINIIIVGRDIYLCLSSC